ncbi:RodZ family helix-turn-helix domain-containing protein [Acidobacterium sp. S8]|uniref:helix-turn-helix domain-containing protein n=1 Tax=Acidobacterium sp. S8 TaxID=1641854 RepID=UPI00131BB220|nr:helix-turn-helix transcriptional regulator [Acidobacterium sp. S8]
MSQFGQELRKEREDRGIAIETITDVTKISGRHLLALEDEHFDALPGGVFNKGIVRGYARVVGLDEEAWVGRFMSAYQASGQVKDDDVSWIQFAENINNGRVDDVPRPDMRLRWAGVAVLLALLSALGWFVWHYVSNRISAEETGVHAPVATAVLNLRPVAQLQTGLPFTDLFPR